MSENCKHEFMPCDCGCWEPRCIYCDNSKRLIDDLAKTVKEKGSGENTK